MTTISILILIIAKRNYYYYCDLTIGEISKESKPLRLMLGSEQSDVYIKKNSNRL